MKILGINSWFHDSCACLLIDGEVAGYVEEERFNRKKHTPEYPKNAINWILEENKLCLDDIDEVVFYINPYGYLKTGLKAAIMNLPRSISLVKKGASTVSPFYRLYKILTLKKHLLKKHNAEGKFKITYLRHYKAHQASTFYASGFKESAIITMDFAVDGTTEVIAQGNDLEIYDHFLNNVPNGFAEVYSAVTLFLGFKWYDEFKIMGMSAYGEPKYQEEIEQLYSFDKSNGKIRLNFKYFDFQYYGMSKLFSDNIEELLGKPRRVENKVTQKEYDIAASLQKVTNKYGISMAKLAKEITGSKNLCLAGGVSQNCLMTQAICNADLFDNVFIQPLSGDVGSALGGALYQYHNKYKKPRKYIMTHLYLGPSYKKETKIQVNNYKLIESESSDWHEAVAEAVAAGLVVGIFDGRMEVGPRALGSRSILADPRRKEMKDILNLRVKHREHFRPFAPSILEEEIENVFLPLKSCRSIHYMIITMTVRKEWRNKIPAITHEDGTARPQAVNRKNSPNYYKIIEKFYKLTKVPLVLNTSFNDNEPIVCRPEDAIECFIRTNIDLLVLNGKLFFRDENKEPIDNRRLALKQTS